MNSSNSNEPVYSEKYAERYDDIWINNEIWKPETKQHIETLRSLLKENTKWLDAGCGTGYFLSCFPKIERTGFDKSEPMLNQARKANPDIELKKIDLRKRVDEWEGKWDLVSCTGQPWTYLPLLSDIYTAVRNLAAYTNNDGKLFLTFFDISDFTENHLPQFNTPAAIPESQFFVNGIIWSLNENGTEHKDMVLPNIDQWIRWFSEFFMQIEILHWERLPHLRISHRSFLCSIKRKPGNTEPSKIIEHPVPK
ncbi:MAG: class I SAM-dependent methyltransferase [Pyrinomonadaceae bacterium]